MELWPHLTKLAIDASLRSTASSHQVGAALLDSEGNLHKGTNIEADNHRSTIHAEDSAISSMILNRTNKLVYAKALVVVARDIQPESTHYYYTFPCGSCRDILFQHSMYGSVNELQVWWEDAPRSFSSIFPRASEKFFI